MSAKRSRDVPIVVSGVSGSGKTTVGSALAARWNRVFIEADDAHSVREIEKMSSGHPLSDGDRLPWLQRVGERIQDEAQLGRLTVTACSALRRSYRDILRGYAPDAFFVMLDGPIEVVRRRIELRRHSFMPASLLESQYATLEPLRSEETGLTLDLSLEVEDIMRAIDAAFDNG